MVLSAGSFMYEQKQWNAGLTFLRSKAGARWTVALITTTSLFLLATFAYSYGRSGSNLAWGAVVSLPGLSILNGGGQPDTQIPTPMTGSETRLPAWIDTPAVFDTSLVPEYNIATETLNTATALHQRLAEAMARFLKRPVLTHAQAKAQNDAACPPDQLTMQVNADQIREEQKNWFAVDAARILEMRRAALNFLEARSIEEGQDALIGPGIGPNGKKIRRGSRGVTIAAGNHRTVDRAVICIKELQKLGWAGGIEVWHFEDELQDETDRAALKDLGVDIHMVSTVKAPGQWKNFELKAETILRSSFDEVLYLDSDNFPLSDVTALFDAPLFTDPRGGRTVFWPDLNRDHPDNAIHRVLGIPCHDAWELDSGQILIAKSGNDGLNLAALYLAQHMQTEGGYWFSGGDKDTFRYAFLVLGIPYTPAPRWLALLGNRFVPWGQGEVFCGAAMLQYGITPPRPQYADPSDPIHPEPLFVHANLLKHMGGVNPGEIFSLMRRLALRQDDVRLVSSNANLSPMDNIAGGAKSLSGRGLCSNIWNFGDIAEVETLGVNDTFGGLMGRFETDYLGYGAKVGAWKN